MLQQYKSILVGLSPQEESDQLSPAARYAIDLAMRMDACLTIHAFVPHLAWVPYSPWTNLPERLAAEFEHKSKNMAGDAVARTKDAAVQAGVECVADIPDLEFGLLTHHFNQQSRVHDVTILDTGIDPLSNVRHLFSEAVFNSGHPVIVVPRNSLATQALRVIIAWDGSARAARAASDAIPLLRAANITWIDAVTGEKELPDVALGADLSVYLSRHGIGSTLTKLSAVDGDVAKALIRHAHSVGADMIVMGAFVHPRAWQALLGGVTRSMLKESPVPLFLAY